MADKSAEQLSALVDSECREQELGFALRRLAKDPDLKARWARYHLIGDALKNNLPDWVDTGLAERVLSAIEAEAELPAHLATTPPWYKRAIGFAAAASLALIITAFAVKQPGGSPGTLSGEQLAGPVTVPAVLEPSTSERLPDARLSSYLVNHNEYASLNSVHGMLSYVRMVGHEPRR